MLARTGKDRVTKEAREFAKIDRYNLCISRKGQFLELPCQLIEKDERVVLLEWYRLINETTRMMRATRYEIPSRTTFLGMFNVSEADTGFYFCTIVYARDGAWFGKFYHTLTKPLLTYVKVLDRKRSELMS